MAYHDNEGFQDSLLSAIKPGTLILTSGGRLARLLRHRFRQEQLGAGRLGWVAPDILSLNAWIRKAWDQSWPLIRPLSHITCLILWKEAAIRVPPPEPLVADLALLETLDETYRALVRHGIPAQGEKSALDPPIVLWRHQIMEVFEELAEDRKGFHPALLPAHLMSALSAGQVSAPDSILLAAFEAPAPIEEALFQSLSKISNLARFRLPIGTPRKIQGIALPDRDQEVAWLVKQLVMHAQNIPLNRIGVVIPDTESYLEQMRKRMGEVLGKSLAQDGSAFNISAGTPLLERSLVRAGLLPLRFWAEGQPRRLLLSLLLSPYYGQWALQRDQIARADRLWRKQGLDAGLRPLLQTLANQASELFAVIDKGSPALEVMLRTLSQPLVRPGAQWANALERFWKTAGFPVIATEADANALGHLTKILQTVREDLKDISMNLAEFTRFFQHLLSRELVHVLGSEEAGIQILGLIESRGLGFEKLYVLGLSAESLPRPVRNLPLLSTSERRCVQGGTAESQFQFAQDAFRCLLACAPHVTLSRPEEEGAEPLAASPFWFDFVSEEICEAVDLWNRPDPVWARAAWLKGTQDGCQSPRAFPPVDPPVEGNLVPETISVSELSSAFACPFRFYAEAILRVFPLEEMDMGISYKEQGNLLHTALALFTRGCRKKGLTKRTDRQAMVGLLSGCVKKALEDASGGTDNLPVDPLTQYGRALEAIRWVGDESRSSGLLLQWLDSELQRLDKGWQWVCEESSFEGLRCANWPFGVSGRIDRIDHHGENGFMLWDYKGGQHPTRLAVTEHLTEPQIPAYVQAVKEHKIAEIDKDLNTTVPVSGGYIGLRAAYAIRHQAIDPKDGDWDALLSRWQEAVARLGKILTSGQFNPEPGPVSNSERKARACQYCPYEALCGKKNIL